MNGSQLMKAAKLWEAGYSTLGIAEMLSALGGPVPEADVYNNIGVIKREAKSVRRYKAR